MHRETSTLYECKGCGGCTASKQMSCPYCGKADGETVEKNTVGGGTQRIQKAWFRRVKIVPEQVQG